MWYPYEETPVHAVIFLDFAGDLWAMPARQISFLCINIQKLVFVVILTNGRKFTGKKSSRCHNIHNFRACSRIMVQTNKKKVTSIFLSLSSLFCTGNGSKTLHMAISAHTGLDHPLGPPWDRPHLPASGKREAFNLPWPHHLSPSVHRLHKHMATNKAPRMPRPRDFWVNAMASMSKLARKRST
jgi:hypothetical protein